MKRERCPLASGSILNLGGKKYRIDAVEGCGGCSIVYRASYRDGLNQDARHHVLIKELFPYHPRGLIYRDERGYLCWDDYAQDMMEICRESFYQGNRANLELLLKNPEQISGNINSCEAYGTYYSILNVHGGTELSALIGDGKYFRLPEAADTVMKILDALQCFHDKEILHLDISPDNVLMLKHQALLIDYNSVRPVKRTGREVHFVSEKEGYSAPELILRDEKNISYTSDIYSVCAVFFRLLTGRKAEETDMMGRGIKKCFPRSLPAFEGQNLTAVQKTVQILARGLYPLPQKRYQNTEELRRDMEELLRRIEGKGISPSAIWEAGSRNYRNQKNTEKYYLNRELQREDGTSLTEEDCFARLLAGENLLVYGTGGMGKTQFQMRLWQNGTKTFRQDVPIVFYIALGDHQQSGGESCFIRKSILRQLKFSEETDGMETALHELNQLFYMAGNKSPRYILLLDGLNEAGSQRQELIREIEELGRFQGIGVLVTDRTAEIKRYGLHDFSAVGLLPLRDEAVAEALKHYGIEAPAEEKLCALLRNPMMLFLYRSTCQIFGESKEYAFRRVPETPSEMVEIYLSNLKTRELRRDSGDEKMQLRHSYLLEHFLPEIAWELKRKGRTLLTIEELYLLAARDYSELQSRKFSMAYPEYMGKSRLILEGIANDREWFDYAVSAQLIGHLNLIVKTHEGNYSLIHDIFADCLAGRAQERQKRLRAYQRKRLQKKALILVLSAAVAAGGIGIGVKALRPADRELTERERTVVKNSLVRLEKDLAVWDEQMQKQYSILEQAETEEVLQNTPEGRARLEKKIEEMTETLNASYEKYEAGEQRRNAYLDELSLTDTGISLGDLEDLYRRPALTKNNMEICLEHLRETLCDEDSPYREAEVRQEMIDAYQMYLDACEEEAYLEVTGLYISLDSDLFEEETEELNEYITKVCYSFHSVLQKRVSLSKASPEDLADARNIVTEGDQSVMNEALRALRLSNYDTDRFVEE